ncbi:MAG: TIGR01244 family phosphatase [Sphingomonadaceae bacterium]|nr:TIGR01244 family phosphatase [Sphingomonadaceae bacterium]
MFRRLDETIMVAAQIAPEDIAEAKRLGATMVINNRPEGEQPGQPSGTEIAAAAQAAGLGYRAIPITPGGFSQHQVDAMREALDAAPGPVLAFCRSGTRSTFVWALARLAKGDDPATLAEKASAQGYDITPLLR